MESLRLVLLLACLSHAAFLEVRQDASSTFDVTDATSAPGIIKPGYVLNGFEECQEKTKTGTKEQDIKDGFSDMIKMIDKDPFNKYKSDFDWNGGAAQDYWGPYERNDPWRELIRVARLHVRCDDPENACSCPEGSSGSVKAYTIRHEAHINFCPEFFNEATLQKAVDGANERVVEYGIRARTWAHELMHVGDIGHGTLSTGNPFIGHRPVNGWPGVPDGTTAYGSLFTKWLAQSEGNANSDPVDNADNYANFLLADYIIKTKGWYPHRYALPIDPSGPPPRIAEEPSATVEGLEPYDPCLAPDPDNDASDPDDGDDDPSVGESDEDPEDTIGEGDDCEKLSSCVINALVTPFMCTCTPDSGETTVSPHSNGVACPTQTCSSGSDAKVRRALADDVTATEPWATAVPDGKETWVRVVRSENVTVVT